MQMVATRGRIPKRPAPGDASGRGADRQMVARDKGVHRATEAVDRRADDRLEHRVVRRLSTIP
jgi:hypothetical protein